MKPGPNAPLILIAFSFVISMSFQVSAAENVEWKTLSTLQMEAPSRDVALSPDGSKIFVLSETGNVHIYSAAGEPEGIIEVGKEADQIRVGPKGDLLILNSRRNRSIRIIQLTYVQDIDVSGSPFKGPEDAPVVLTIFDDFECPYCARLAPVLDQVVKQYPEAVKLVFKHFPLRNHKHALKAAMASMAAEKQGKFWEFHNLLFANYNQLSDEKIEEIARALNLDMERFQTDMQDPALMNKLRQDMMQAVNAGVRGTPTLFVNGKRLQDRSMAGFQKAIQEELEKADPAGSESDS
jgi:protein-disulfide isomerase